MDSEIVLSYFKDITRIPRESGHEEHIIAYLQKFASEHGLESRTDGAGNVVIVKQASPGKENVPVIVLQSHSDMVCEKNSGVEHDFSKDPISYVIRDGWMIAENTTLGADCGIGMAAQLAILAGDTDTGRIECLFTVSEETGLYGAKALKPGFITGRTLINLDSEDEGELFIGCAGGLDTTAVFDYTAENLNEGDEIISLAVRNGVGGHSGDDIDKGRANAVQLMARFLCSILSKGNMRIAGINGGNKRNAIAREAFCDIAVSAGDSASILKDFEVFAGDVRKEYAVTDPDLEFLHGNPDMEYSSCISKVDTDRIVRALFAAPHGVLAMSHEIAGMVETSTNLASVSMIGNNRIRVGTSQRSSVDSEKRMAGQKVRAVFELAGAQVSHESEYPGWKPDVGSVILKYCVSAYEELFGTKPVVRAIHAGLECGLFLDIYPGLDMISFGPTIRGVHAPGERLDLDSMKKFVDLLVKVLVDFK